MYSNFEYLRDVFCYNVFTNDKLIKKAIKALTPEENKQLTALMQDVLSSVNEFALTQFMRYFAKDFYRQLNTQTKIHIQAFIRLGVREGKLNYITGKVSGDFALAAAFAADNLNLFYIKNNIISAAREHALKSPLAQNFSVWFYNNYVRLDRERNLRYYLKVLNSKKLLNKCEYTFLRLYIDDKQSELYPLFERQIVRYEKTHIDIQDRLPEKRIIPF